VTSKMRGRRARGTLGFARCFMAMGLEMIENLVRKVHEPHTGKAEAEGIPGNRADHKFMMIKINFLLDLAKATGLADPFHKASFVEEIIGMEDADNGIKELHAGGEGALEDKAQVGILLNGVVITNRFLEG